MSLCLVMSLWLATGPPRGSPRWTQVPPASHRQLQVEKKSKFRSFIRRGSDPFHNFQMSKRLLQHMHSTAQTPEVILGLWVAVSVGG